jgi:hypothetical protein
MAVYLWLSSDRNWDERDVVYRTARLRSCLGCCVQNSSTTYLCGSMAVTGSNLPLVVQAFG